MIRKFARLPLYKVLGLHFARRVWQYAFQRRTPGSAIYYRLREKHIRAICSRVRGQEEALGDVLSNPAYARFDERLVEYPFVRARTKPGHRVLDVGSTMNTPFHLEWLKEKFREVHFLNITYEHLFGSGSISMIVGDIRQTFLPSNYYDQVICLSTLEHVGKDNSRYLGGHESAEVSPDGRGDEAWIQAMNEMMRLCAPGGTVLVTVPYGLAEDFGWFHVFDQGKLSRLRAAVEKRASMHSWYFRATQSGWAEIQADDAVGSAYAGGSRSVASAVACLEILKNA